MFLVIFTKVRIKGKPNMGTDGRFSRYGKDKEQRR
jgi:hypothetical protein